MSVKHHLVAIVFGMLGAIGMRILFVRLDPAHAPLKFDGISLGEMLLGFVVAYPMGYLFVSLFRFDATDRSPPIVNSQNVAVAPIVGGTCVVCGKKILFLAEGGSCANCHSVFHYSCAPTNHCPRCRSTTEGAAG